MNITTDINLSTESYSPFVKIFLEENKRTKFTPVKFKQDYIKYDIYGMTQEVYPDGTYGRQWFNIIIDYSNIGIQNRWEILDL